MKKVIKLLLLLVLVLSISFIFTHNYVYADINPNTYSPDGNVERSIVINYGSKISQTLTLFGIIVAVIALMILGLKFILASTTEKAEYKKFLLPVVIGIFIIASITGIVTLLANIGDNINNSVQEQGMNYWEELKEADFMIKYEKIPKIS